MPKNKTIKKPKTNNPDEAREFAAALRLQFAATLRLGHLLIPDNDYGPDSKREFIKGILDRFDASAWNDEALYQLLNLALSNATTREQAAVSAFIHSEHDMLRFCAERGYFENDDVAARQERELLEKVAS